VRGDIDAIGDLLHRGGRDPLGLEEFERDLHERIAGLDLLALTAAQCGTVVECQRVRHEF
jgi:hypothetical protein